MVLIEGVGDEDAIEEMRSYQGLWLESDAKYQTNKLSVVFF